VAHTRLSYIPRVPLPLVVDLPDIVKDRRRPRRVGGGATSARQFDGGAEKAGRVRALANVDLEPTRLQNAVEAMAHE
jgi:hypothetical protein